MVTWQHHDPQSMRSSICLFCVGDPKETEDTDVSLSYIMSDYLSHFALVIRIRKTYLALDLPIYGKVDGANFI